MAKVTSLTAEEQNVMSRLGKKLPKELKRQDRAASSPVKEQKPPRAAGIKEGTMQAQAEGSPGSNMGHTMKTSPVKITAKTAKERS